MTPITKIWFMRLKPSVSVSDQAFKDHWTEVLNFVNNASGSTSAAHQLWQHISVPQCLVMISGYPSQESTDKADKEYVQRYYNQMGELVEHMGLKELQLDAELIRSPLLDSPVLSIETFSVVGEEQSEFEAKEMEKQMEATGLVVGGWDMWPDVQRAEKGLHGERGNDKDWVRLTGWRNEKECLEASLKDISPVQGLASMPELLNKVFLRKIME
jgi:hypothetical protein